MITRPCLLLCLLCQPALAAPLEIVGDVAGLRSSNHGSTPDIYLSGYTATSLDGGGYLKLDASDTSTADDNCTVFVDSAAHRFKRPSIASGLPIEYCGGAVGLADNAAALGYAKAAINAFVPTYGAPVNVLFGSGNYSFASGISFDAAKTGLSGPSGGKARLKFTAISSSATAVSVGSTSVNPQQNDRAVLENLDVWGPDQNGTGTCIKYEGTGGYVASVATRDVSVYGCGFGISIGANAFILDFDHIQLTFNGIGLHVPGGVDNSGENIVVSGGSTISNNTKYGVYVTNPNASVKIDHTSIDYNYNIGTGNPCQVFQIDGSISYAQSHSEANAQTFNCIASGTGTPVLDLTDITLVRQTPTTNYLVWAGSGSFVSVKGGEVRSNGAPNPTFLVTSGGNLSLYGTRVGAASLVAWPGGTYRYYPTGLPSSSNLP